jgi:hypothetical protein
VEAKGVRTTGERKSEVTVEEDRERQEGGKRG